MHGDREPHSKPLSTSGGGKCVSGAPNELWSFGDEAYAILEKYLRLRERMRPYVREPDVRSSYEGRSDHPSVVLRLSCGRPSLGRRECLYVRSGCARRTHFV